MSAWSPENRADRRGDVHVQEGLAVLHAARKRQQRDTDEHEPQRHPARGKRAGERKGRGEDAKRPDPAHGGLPRRWREGGQELGGRQRDDRPLQPLQIGGPGHELRSREVDADRPQHQQQLGASDGDGARLHPVIRQQHDGQLRGQSDDHERHPRRFEWHRAAGEPGRTPDHPHDEEHRGQRLSHHQALADRAAGERAQLQERRGPEDRVQLNAPQRPLQGDAEYDEGDRERGEAQRVEPGAHDASACALAALWPSVLARYALYSGR